MPIVLPFPTSVRKVAVLGGGVTGLSAAYHLVRLGHEVRLFEVTGRVAGAIRTETADGWLSETGFEMLEECATSMTVLEHAIGAYRQRLVAPPKARRHLVHDGRLRVAPRSALGTALSPLVPLEAKFRGVGEMFIRNSLDRHDRSLDELARSHFGARTAALFAQAFAAEACGGDAARLSAQFAFPRLWEIWCDHGSLLRGRLAHVWRCYEKNEFIDFPLVTFTRGLQTIVHGMVLQLPADVIVPYARAEGLVPGPRWHVIWRDVRGQPDAADSGWSESDDTGRQVEGFDAVISALPGAALARLAVGDREAHPLAPLARLEYAPFGTLFLGFRRGQVRRWRPGFGLVSPIGERRAIVRATFTSNLFPGRAPEDHVALNVTAGGVSRPELARLSAEDLLAAVRPDLRDLLGVVGDPVVVRHHAWPRGAPQYHVGHLDFLRTMGQCERAHPGLFLGGSPREAVSLAQCLIAGERLALRALRYSPE